MSEYNILLYLATKIVLQSHETSLLMDCRSDINTLHHINSFKSSTIYSLQFLYWKQLQMFQCQYNYFQVVRIFFYFKVLCCHSVSFSILYFLPNLPKGFTMKCKKNPSDSICRVDDIHIIKLIFINIQISKKDVGHLI